MELFWKAMAWVNSIFKRFFDWIRGNKPFPETKVVYISGATQDEMAIINEIESKIPEVAKQLEMDTYHREPHVQIIRNPDEIMFHNGMKWSDYTGVRMIDERVEGEGLSGLWSSPYLYVSVIGDRNTMESFKELYAHERSHSFFEVGSGHHEMQEKVEALLKG